MTMELTDWLEYERVHLPDPLDDRAMYEAEIAWRRSQNIFYIGLNARWQMYKFLPPGLNIMFSAGHWQPEKQDWPRSKFPKKAGLRFLDSGGYKLLNKYGAYPFTTPMFMNLVARLNPDYYATLDYPCEPNITRMLDNMTNEERIRSTVRNAAKMASWSSQVPGAMVPVIQGYTLCEYQSCIDLHHQADTIRPYMAVGSMCRRISNHELHRLIPGIYEHAYAAGVERLHYFGLKLSPDLADLTEFIYSRDSAVAMDAYDKGLRATRDGRRYPRGQAEKKAVFVSFLGRLAKLGLRYCGGMQ